MFKHSIAFVLVLVVALSAVGVAAAQDPGDGPAAGPGEGRGRAVVRLHVIVLETAADALNMTTLEMLRAAEPGVSLAEVITANGGDVNQVTADAKAAATEDVNNALAEGKITEEESERLLDALDDSIARIMERAVPSFDDRRDGRANPTEMVLIQQAAEAVDASVQDVLEANRNGQSIAEFVTANGGDPDQVVADTVALATDEINAAVEEGRITQEQADTLLSELEAKVSDEITSTEPIRNPRRGHDGPGRRDGDIFPVRPSLEIIAEELGVDPQEVREQLRDGGSINDVIVALGGDPAVIQQALIDAATEAINEAVENDRISQERADDLLENLDQKIEEAMSQERPAREFDRPQRGEGRRFSGEGEGVLE